MSLVYYIERYVSFSQYYYYCSLLSPLSILKLPIGIGVPKVRVASIPIDIDIDTEADTDLEVDSASDSTRETIRL